MKNSASLNACAEVSYFLSTPRICFYVLVYDLFIHNFKPTWPRMIFYVRVILVNLQYSGHSNAYGVVLVV